MDRAESESGLQDSLQLPESEADTATVVLINHSRETISTKFIFVYWCMADICRRYVKHFIGCLKDKIMLGSKKYPKKT
jgi:hypothetical protein